MADVVRIDQRKIKELLAQTVSKKLLAIAFKMERDIKQSMRGYGQYSNVETKKLVVGVLRQEKGKKKYHYPSPPGSPPAVDTGRLLSSISVAWSMLVNGMSKQEKLSGDQNAISAPATIPNTIKVVVGTKVTYAPSLEYGTSKMKARPFLRPIFDKYKSAVGNL
jgi:hypothetical protein